MKTDLDFPRLWGCPFGPRSSGGYLVCSERISPVDVRLSTLDFLLRMKRYTPYPQDSNRSTLNPREHYTPKSNCILNRMLSKSPAPKCAHEDEMIHVVLHTSILKCCMTLHVLNTGHSGRSRGVPLDPQYRNLGKAAHDHGKIGAFAYAAVDASLIRHRSLLCKVVVPSYRRADHVGHHKF